MSDLSGVDLNDPAVRAQLGLEERAEGGPPEPTAPETNQSAFHRVRETLTETIKAKSQAEAQLATLQRELAIERAGLPANPMKELFLKAYDGPADAEAIKAEAIKYGILNAEGQVPSAPAPAEAPEPAPAVSAAELAQHRVVGDVAAGSTSGNDVPLELAIQSAKNPEELMKILNQAPSEAGLNVKPNLA